MMALTDVPWEQRVLRACWRVSFRPPRHLHQRLSLPQQQQEPDSCSKRGNSGARLRRVSWNADPTNAMNVAAQRCRVSANTVMANHARGAWSAARRLSRVKKPCRRAGQRERGRVGRIGPSTSETDSTFDGWDSAVCAPKGDQEARGAKARSALDFVLESLLDRNVGTQPVQTKEDRVGRNGEVIRLKLGTANVTTLYPREQGSVGVSTRWLQLAQHFHKEGYQGAWPPRNKGEEVCTVHMRRVACLVRGGGSTQERSRSLA